MMQLLLTIDNRTVDILKSDEIIQELEAKVEKQRLQLVACEQVSLGNVRGSKRLNNTDPAWSKAYKMVADAVDREILNREYHEKVSHELAEAKKQLTDCQSKLGEKRFYRATPITFNYSYTCEA